MIYRCLACQHEESRGCLPTVTCGLYMFFLQGLAAAIGIVIAHGIRVWAEAHRPAEAPPPPEMPWWVIAIFVVIGLPLTFFLTLLGAWGLHIVMAWTEYLAFARRRCPACRGRKWSRGFTRGFGL